MAPPPTMLQYQAPIGQAMSCLVAAGVQVPITAVMNFPKLALSAGALEWGRRVSPRSICSPTLSEVRAMKLKWGKLGKRGRRPFTGCPTSKTNKNLRRARKRAIAISKIWRVHAPPANHNYTDLSLRLRFTRKYDPYQELSYYSFEECLAAALLVRFNMTCPRQKRGKPSSPKDERGKPSSPAPKGERGKPSSPAPKGERSHPRKRKPRRAC
jgi:hypothetical protein